MAGVGGLAWTLLIALHAVDGRLEAFYGAMVLHNSAYAGSLSRNLFRGFTLEPILAGRLLLGSTIVLAALASATAVLILDRRRRRCWALLLAYGLGAFVAVCLPGKFYAHYFQLIVPPLLLALAWGVAAAVQAIGRSRAWLPHAGAAVLVLALVGFESRYYRTSPGEFLPGRYAEIYLAAQRIGTLLGGQLEPEEGVFQWGEETGIYFFSGRRTPSQPICFALVGGALGEQLSERALLDLERNPPELVLIARYFARWNEEHPVLKLLRSQYAPYEAKDPRTRRYFEIRVRRGGSLEKRLDRFEL